MNQKIDLRIQKTYTALHNAFTALLEEKAFEEITINELCDAAMIRRTTFYKHFADKYEYFKFYLLELRASFKSNISTETLASDPIAYSITMLHEMFQFVLKHQKLVVRLQNSNMLSFLHQAFQEQFAEELREIFIVVNNKMPTPKVELLISFYAGGLMNVVYWWIQNPTQLSEEEIASLLAKTIVPPKEILS